MSRSRAKRKKRKMNPTYWVFCEGETEEAYINFLKSHFRLPSIQIKAKVKGNSINQNYIAQYLKGAFTTSKDQVFLLYDIDAPKMLDRLCKIEDCELLISNPCIEFWFLLHYKNHKAVCKEAFCIKELKNRNGKYRKGVIDDQLLEKLVDKMDKAIERAKALDSPKNPSSTLYRLVELLKEA